jgi:hypothetical protein
LNPDICDVEEGEQSYAEVARKSYESVDAKDAEVEEEDGQFDEVDHERVHQRRGGQ